MRNKFFSIVIPAVACVLFFTQCKKMLEISPPINSITTNDVFATNSQAEWAIAAIYSKMINGVEYYNIPNASLKSFAAGLSTIMGSHSADDLVNTAGEQLPVLQNKLTITNSNETAEIWNSAYKVIFDANAVMEGLDASTSPTLYDSVKKQLTGEALALRAFSYFYLVNFFGDLPLVLTTDFKKTLAYSRSPVSKIYDQIKADLVRARSLLGNDFAAGKQERVRINKWFAEALLSRVYLYTGEYQLAINSATAVINHTALFSMEQDLNNVFMPNSSESIFQLKPTIEDPYLGTATPEGFRLYVYQYPDGSYFYSYLASNQLLNAFEANDKRKSIWLFDIVSGHVPAKYKKGTPRQYYTVMRLAELYLIRAEATVLLSPAAKNTAIEDLNVLRRRADVDELDSQLTAEQVITAIAHERQVELFAEWGHRWFDLKRTGKAHDVLAAISAKQPWWGDYQLLYPIPTGDIKQNSNLLQNPEYDFR